MLDVAEISFFELDKLFSQSARALKRKTRRRRVTEQEGDANDRNVSRSRSPVAKGRTYKKVPPFGGFTGAVGTVEKTVIVTGVPPSADEKILFKHFARCGNIIDVRLVRNRHDMATGVVIVEFEQDEALNRACELPPPHNEILGTPVVVTRADAQMEKDKPPVKRTMTRQQFTQQVLSGLRGGTDSGPNTGPNMRKLHVKNLRPVVTEEDMRGIFRPFGDFDNFDMGSQECWITFKNHNDAQDAMSSMQGFQLVGQELQISMEPASTPLSVAATILLPPPKATQETMDSSVKADSDFGATGSGGNAMTNRIELMKKLMSSHSQGGIPTVVGQAAPSSGGPAPPPPPGAPPATATPAGPPDAKPGGPSSRTLLLQNMFTPSTVSLAKDPRFYEEIREDTHDECMKFGKVLHVTVDPRGDTGLIYVLYEAPAQRSAAEMALNGRWFEGKKIIAMGIDDSIWQALAAQAQGAGPREG